MKGYIYETATGTVTIEVAEKWHKLLSDADAEEMKSNRKHTRADHKYAPGEPIPLGSLDDGGKWFADEKNGIEAVEFSIDMERALATLTEVQRRYVILSRIQGYSFVEIARLTGKDKSTVRKAVNVAEQKIKNYFA
jgi:RNA polymerase sigma factor (sigma-70 family)